MHCNGHYCVILGPDGGQSSSDEASKASAGCGPSITKIRKVRRGQLKETKKAKLSENLATRLTKKFKQKLTVRRLQEKLSDSESLHLLSSPPPSLSSSSSSSSSPPHSKTCTAAVRRKGSKNSKKHTPVASNEDAVRSSNPRKVSTWDIVSSNGGRQKGKTPKKFPKVSNNASIEDLHDGDFSCDSDEQTPDVPLLTSDKDERRRKRLEARRLRRQRRRVCPSSFSHWYSHVCFLFLTGMFQLQRARSRGPGLSPAVF